jgi:hypothetical protein
MLTVQQLIDQLQQIKDKDVEIVFDEGGAFYELMGTKDNSNTYCTVDLIGKKIYKG